MIFLYVSAVFSAASYSLSCSTAECDNLASTREFFKINEQIKVIASTNVNDTTDGFIRFYPKVDTFSMLRIPDDNFEFAREENSSISVSIKNFTTPSHAYRKGEYVVEFLSLIAFFDQGKLTGINWDSSFDTNSCKFREGIIQNTCGVKMPIDSINRTKNNFIKIFMGFVGTDIKKTPMKSAQSMPSTFVKFGVGGVIDDATKFVNSAIDWFKNI